MIVLPAGANPGKYPTLGFDPAPGEPAAVDATSTKIAKVAGDLDRMQDTLKRVTTVEGIWQGQAAQAFVRAMEPLPKQADEIVRALHKASSLLADWEGSLGGYQRRASNLEDQAAAAKRGLEQARSNPALDLAGQSFPDEESLRQAEARYDAAVQDVRMWEDRLQEIIDQARRLLETHQDEADRTAQQLNEIVADVPGLAAMLGAIGDFPGEVWDWIRENADFINNIGDAFSAMSTLLSASALATAAASVEVPFLAPVAGFLGYASAATSFVALSAHLLAREAGAKVSGETITGDAFGLGAPMVGKLADKVGTLGPKLAAKGVDISALGAEVKGPEGVGGVVDDLKTYWLPDDVTEGMVAYIPGVGPPALAVWNAWEEAQKTND